MKISTLTPSQRIAHGISIALIPPTISLIAFSLLTAWYESGTALHTFSVGFVAVFFSGIFPMLYVLYLRRERIVSRYDVPSREQRTNPYLMSVFYSALGFFLLLYMKANTYVTALMWCYSINTFILMLINKRWKISAHMMGFTGPLVMLSTIFGLQVLYAFPLMIALGWARVALKVHTIGQVVAGAIAGSVLTAIQIALIFQVGNYILRLL